MKLKILTLHFKFLVLNLKSKEVISMNEAGLKELVEKIVNVKAEFQTIEVKRSNTECSCSP